jgi:hypothetical protein
MQDKPQHKHGKTYFDKDQAGRHPAPMHVQCLFTRRLLGSWLDADSFGVLFVYVGRIHPVLELLQV